MRLGRKKKDLFAGVPGPSPWYLRDPEAPLPAGYKWQDLGETEHLTGKMLLLGPQGPVAILGFHNHVALLDSGALLIWHQEASDSPDSTAPVRFIVFDPDQAPPLRDMESLCRRMDEENLPSVFACDPSVEFLLPTTVVGEALHVTFPPEFTMEELLLWSHSSGIPRETPQSLNDVALLVAQPRESTYQLYPQDWFNNNIETDFGYVWITRVARDSKTGRVRGEGIRMSPFELDDSLRQRSVSRPS